MTPREILTANLDKLSPKDRTFAESLLRNHDTVKVQHWIGVLIERATKPADADNRGALGFLPIHTLLHKAAEKLQAPKVLAQAGDITLRLTIAGSASKNAGDINVTAAETNGQFNDYGHPQRDWFGRISAAGEYFPSAKHPQTAILAALRTIAADPAAAAKLYGQRTGACCFCGRELTDGASIAVGYGPICAERYGLPHGEDHGVKGGHRQHDFSFAAGQ